MICRQSPPATSAVFRSQQPEDDGDWTLAEKLLALSVNHLAWLRWAKTEDGSKNKNQPEPILWPSALRDKPEGLRVGEVMTIEEFEARMAEKSRRAA